MAMPGPLTRELNPGMSSANQKKKANNRKQQRRLKRIRVIYSDPYLTDSSSDDEQGTHQHEKYPSDGVKRCVKEVQILESFSPSTVGDKTFIVPNENVLNQRGTRLKSNYVGVRRRKNGNWVAEIQDPCGVRQCLGTYNTEKEAHSAYDERKKLEFEDLIQQKRLNTPIASLNDRPIGSSVARSPSSVLGVSNMISHGSDMNANGSMKQVCNIKEAKEEKAEIVDELKIAMDFKIIFDELKQEDILKCSLGDLADTPNSSSSLDLDLEDHSWLNGVLNLCGFED